MSAMNISDFLTVLKTRREHYQQLLELSRRQMELINENDYSQLLVLLGRKQRVLGCLDGLNACNPNLWQQWRTDRGSAEPALRDECEHVLAETESILAELLKEEQSSTDHLTQQRDVTQRQLQAISEGSQIHEAYRDSLAPVTHRHLNIDQ